MRMFFSFMRAPLWLKAVMIVLIVGGALVLRDGRVTEMAKEQAMAFAETQVGAMLDQALADAADAMGMEGLDLFGSLGVSSGSGAADGFVANSGHKSERVATPVADINWKERALSIGQNLLNSPQTLFMIVVGLVFFAMLVSSIKRLLGRIAKTDDPGNKSKYAMKTSVDLPGFDLDAAFADPKAAPDMKAVLEQQAASNDGPEGDLSLRANVKATVKKVAASKAKARKPKRQSKSLGTSLFGSRQPSALLKEKLQSDPFDRLPS